MQVTHHISEYRCNKVFACEIRVTVKGQCLPRHEICACKCCDTSAGEITLLLQSTSTGALEMHWNFYNCCLLTSSETRMTFNFRKVFYIESHDRIIHIYENGNSLTFSCCTAEQVYFLKILHYVIQSPIQHNLEER